MQIVSLQQFLALPAGTVFCAYMADEDGADLFGELRIKDCSVPGGCGYLYSPLNEPWVIDGYEVLDPAKRFSVLEPADVASLIVRLTKALNDSGVAESEMVRLLGEASAAHTLDEVAA